MNKVVYADLMARANEAGMVRPRDQVGVAPLLVEVLERAVGAMRYAASEVDQLRPEEFWVHQVDAQGNILAVPNKWYRLEVECRAEVERLAGMMAKLGIADRLAKVEEAKAAVLVSCLRDACRDAGLDAKTQRRLAQALQARVSQVEGAEAAA